MPPRHAAASRGVSPTGEPSAAAGSVGRVDEVDTADASVRPALATDATAIADVQVRSWRAAYARLLPAEDLTSITDETAHRQYTDHWRQSVEHPPSSHHRVLAALARNTLVGFAAYAPCTDDDCWPRTDAELLTLTVDPEHERAGHGSRLLNATVDLLREDGYQTLSTWAFADDTRFREFLESAGWAGDGSKRGLDLAGATADAIVEQHRLGTRLA